MAASVVRTFLILALLLCWPARGGDAVPRCNAGRLDLAQLRAGRLNPVELQIDPVDTRTSRFRVGPFDADRPLHYSVSRECSTTRSPSLAQR